jgi:hypothetical protein
LSTIVPTGSVTFTSTALLAMYMGCPGSQPSALPGVLRSEPSHHSHPRQSRGLKRQRVYCDYDDCMFSLLRRRVAGALP